MSRDMLTDIEEKRVSNIVLPGGHTIKEFSKNFDTRGTTTFSIGNIFVEELHAGYPYGQLQSAFQVVDFLEVSKFIEQHTFLYNAMFEIEVAIRKYFPSKTLRLEVYSDPEREMEDELAVYILTKDEPHVALAKLNEFDNEFWLNQVDSYRELVSINLKYV